MEQSWENSNRTSVSGPLRVRSGIIIVSIQWILWFFIPRMIPEAFLAGVFAGILGWIAVLVWWAFLSGAPRPERWGAIAIMVALMVLSSIFLDRSIATANMGMMYPIYSVPVISLAFVIWAAATRRLSTVIRRTTMLATLLIASGFWVFLRTDGMTGTGFHDLKWRWAETHEARLLAGSEDEKTDLFPAGRDTKSKVVWPGFRGPERDGIIPGVKIGTDWLGSPPEEIWRKPIGPGCSSFAVQGNLFYTQEQRGEYEVVSCYDLVSGETVWKHQDLARFYDSHAGAGPRSTPAIDDGRIYTLGATGILNALDAYDGSVIWTLNAAEMAGVEPLRWGFAASPLVVDEVVVVAISGKLAAYDRRDGDPVWSGPDGGASYSSPHLITVGGTAQVMHMSNSGVLSFDPATGKMLWEHSWPTGGCILQPAVIGSNDLLITGEKNRVRRLRITKDPDGWQVSEQWTAEGIRFNFNDLVVHKGHFYGFDGPSLACFSLEDGRRLWKGERYQGWLLLLKDQDLLLVLSEKGELALVPASPDRFDELSRISVLEGKTWNHPVVTGRVFLARNAMEMTAYRLPPN